MKVRIVGPTGRGIVYATPFGLVHTDRDGIAHPSDKQLEHLRQRKDLTIDFLDLPRSDSPVTHTAAPRRRKAR